MARARFLTRVQPRQEGVEVANAREAVIRPAIGNRCGDGMPQVKLISSRSPSSLLRIIIRVTGSPQGATGTWAMPVRDGSSSGSASPLISSSRWTPYTPIRAGMPSSWRSSCTGYTTLPKRRHSARPSSPAGRSSRGRQSTLVLFVATAQTRVAFNRPPESSTRISPMLVAPVSSNRRADHSPARTRCR